MGDVNKRDAVDSIKETPFTRVMEKELSHQYGFECKVVQIKVTRAADKHREFRVAGSDSKGNWCYGQNSNFHVAKELMIRERDRWLSSGFTSLLGRGNLVSTKGTEGITDMKGKT